MPLVIPSPSILRCPDAVSLTVPITASVMSLSSDCTCALFLYMPPIVMPACVKARRALIAV
eukprot:5120185-Pleurochrysis_carterae.AAC.1